MPSKSRKQQNTDIQARRFQVLRLKSAGMTVRAIGDQLGISHTQVERDLKAVLGEMARLHQPDADAIRELMMERYDRLLLAWWPTAIGQGRQNDDGTISAGNPSDQATGRVLSILKSMREMNGLDVPVVQKHELGGAEGAPLVSTVQVVWNEPPPPPEGNNPNNSNNTEAGGLDGD